ncbi:5-formyltetrahydrofolate cyclo-ligase [Jatrophihabitans telluris]|uniref:5-formyltetrahydrofolate cyclo-ligase n=1 Tax=Jatrophihabitans telluris TaxID=2038343 RepID=A0ABY4R025_9ACTN|nr:5-formyltetrahydrofolate cyclo-ligase [Jatrophihabitans telluris]UQX89238.1 5-formyltetrahydrofolate cyclo-ligase [Jatrophihabitans telluris]
MNVKSDVRLSIAERRRAMPDADRSVARAAIRTAVLARVGALGPAQGSVIAAYEPLRTEPGSVELLAALTAAGYRVLVPLTLPDKDLDWVEWASPDSPSGQAPALGKDAITSADLVLVPAFAVAPDGARLGRGGGSYDRALARVRATVPVAALLYAGELLPEVPVDPWDRPVNAVVQPDGWHELGV